MGLGRRFRRCLPCGNFAVRQPWWHLLSFKLYLHFRGELWRCCMLPFLYVDPNATCDGFINVGSIKLRPNDSSHSGLRGPYLDTLSSEELVFLLPAWPDWSLRSFRPHRQYRWPLRSKRSGRSIRQPCLCGTCAQSLFELTLLTTIFCDTG
jgi:hypothetical protein